jgi:hypothetical protein
MTNNNAAQRREVWIHIHPDGHEETFSSNPRYLRTLHVEERDGLQFTKTWNRNATSEPVMPPGGGWELFDDKDSTFTVWRRFVRSL